MKIKVLISLFLIIGFITSCKRELPQGWDNTDKAAAVDVKQLVAPQNFDFSTDKQIKIRVAVLGKTFDKERFIVRLYREVPNAGSLILSGAVDAISGQYSTTITVPNTQEYIWIEKISSTGASEYAKVQVKANISHVFYADNSTGLIKRKSSSGLDCSSNCTQTYNNHSGTITVNSGEVACFSGTINSTINVQDGGAVKICASGTINGLSINGYGRAYILESAVITASNINGNGTASEFYNWSDSLTINSSVSMNGFAENHGKMFINGDLNINTGASFGNYGQLNISSNLNVNNSFTNYSRVSVSGTMNNNSNSVFYNYCNLTVTSNLSNNGTLYNGRLVKCLQTYTQNSTGTTELDNVGLLSTENLMVNGTIKGIGLSQAVVKVTNTTTINSSGKFIGNVDLCDSNGVETNNGTIQAPAAISCGGYVPTCACDTEGFGTPHIEDNDGDGIPNNQDDYPNDPLRAFNSYIPCFNVCYSISFEDLWPTTGDYDYNDMVVKFSVHKVLDANNNVKDMKFLVQPLAVGASYDNGFGFRLDNVLPANVDSVKGQSLIRNIIQLNGNGTEAAQDRAVIVCFDSPEPLIHRASSGMFNTQKDRPQGTSTVQTVVVTFSTPVDNALLDIANLNPFIFTNRRRGYEIHMKNHLPTNLANTSLFGTYNDRSNPSEGKYYVTQNGLPWAFMLECDFDYPIEKTSITDAYNYFDDWVQSGGTQYPNWYRNFPQYRNNELVY